jgi:membrane associated rhomboid family serine protease
MARWFALRWVALGILLGAIAGTAIDATVAGFGVGLVAGIAMAQLRARHR